MKWLVLCARWAGSWLLRSDVLAANAIYGLQCTGEPLTELKQIDEQVIEKADISAAVSSKPLRKKLTSQHISV